jgi:CubicO group peptidase (beta-lactamase class C family)
MTPVFVRTAILALTFASAATGQAIAPWPTSEWAVSTPAAQQINAAPWAALDSAIRAGQYGNVDRLLVIRRGYKVIDHTYPRDYRAIAAGKRTTIGCGPGDCTGFKAAPGFNYFDPETHPFFQGRDVHSLQSVTKSVIATVLGTAVQRGAIRRMDVPLLSLLPSYRDVQTDARLAKATLADLLTMRSGIEWHEGDRPLDSTNTTVQLEASDDWARFTLRQPMDAEPGAKWVYNSGGSHLIGAVIRDATGESPVEYARKHLFTPLGIRDFHWKPTPGGLPDGEGGLYLSAESIAKIGYLYLRGGEWDGTRILPADWAREATSKIVTLGNAGRGYGYQWWRVDQNDVEIWAGQGFGGQFLLVVPSADIVAVSFAWNVFGARVPALLAPMIQAIQTSTGR